MATILLEYDGRNAVFKKMIEVLVSLGAKATPVKNSAHAYSPQAREIAEQVNGILKGTIKTRPASCLLNEL